MMRLVKFIILISIGAGLYACSSYLPNSNQSESISVENNSNVENEISQIIAPYSDSMKQEMSEQICVASEDFIVQRKPSGNLNNWFAQAIFSHQTKAIRMSEPIFCLFNNGGIRSSIGKGNVSLGDMFKVMPFDNRIVWVKLPVSSLKDIHAYILKSGGEPIANATMKATELQVNGLQKHHEFVWIITSDYLANNGDKMYFFQNKIEVIDKNMLLRDALIEEAKFQQTLISDTTNYMQF